MRKLFFVIAAMLLVGTAQAQLIDYDLGPSLGAKKQLADTYVGGFNPQTGTTYTILTTDMGKIVSFSNGSAIAVTLPQAGTSGFEGNKCFSVVDLGAGTATVTPTTSTINGGSTKTYATGAGGRICSDGTNYLAY